MPNKELNFKMQLQLNPNWCWTANATSISKHYNRYAHWTQCNLACSCLNRNDCCLNPTPSSCNIPYYLHIALDRTRNLRSFFVGRLTPDLIINEINNGWVIGVRIGWRNDGGHFVTIHGYDDTKEEMFVYISDPIFGKSYLRLSDFSNGYINNGEWTHTYLIKAPKSMIEYTRVNIDLLERARNFIPSNLYDLLVENSKVTSDLSMPHNSYIIDYSSLKNGDKIELVQDGIRLMDKNSRGDNLIYEFSGSGESNIEFKQVIYGDEYVDNYKEILKKIIEDVSSDEEVYHISLVRQPQLKVDAICLSGSKNTYFPLIDNGFLTRGASYNADTFFQLLKQHAQNKLGTDDNLLGG